MVDALRLPTPNRLAALSGVNVLRSGLAMPNALPQLQQRLSYVDRIPDRWRGLGTLGASTTKADEVLARLLPAMTGSVFNSMFGGGGAVGAPFTNVNAIAGGALAPAAPYINAAAQRNGIPANLLAAIIARESTGNWARDGHRYVYLPERGYNILPYVGMTDPAVRRVGMDPRSLIGNMEMQIEAAARLIRQIADNEAKGYGWQGVANVYYSGDPTGRTTPSDSRQYGSTAQYGNDILNFWEILEPGGPSRVGSAPSLFGNSGFGSMGSMGLGIESIWGGAQVPLTQEFGLTDFAKTKLGSWYSYATAYGVQGHAGLDYGTQLNTPIYTPVSGTVVYAGGTGYYTDERYGNRAGSGEFRIRLDNGDELILGHMASISVRPGQRINAGTLVGYSGTYNGAHVHVEYRQYTPGKTSSGYTAIDPRQALGGSLGIGQMPTMQQGFGTLGSSIGSSTADFARAVWNWR